MGTTFPTETKHGEIVAAVFHGGISGDLLRSNEVQRFDLSARCKKTKIL